MDKGMSYMFWTAFLLWTAGIGAAGWLVLWDEIENIREMIPDDNRDGTDNCYDNPLLNMQIWTKEGHFYPSYKMQDVVAYFECLETEEALDEIQFFYISYNPGGLAAFMGFLAFIVRWIGYRWKAAIELVFLPLIFGIGEGAFIYFLAGLYQEDGIGGLTDIYCQLCSSLGMIWWALLAFLLLMTIYGFCKKCCKSSKDRQRGKNVGTCRDYTERRIQLSEVEMRDSQIF